MQSNKDCCSVCHNANCGIFFYITNNKIKNKMNNTLNNTNTRQFNVALEKKINAKKMQMPIKKMNINIFWRKSKVYGLCPALYGTITFYNDDIIKTKKYYAGGCGYDKESQVISEIFNDYLSYLLYNLDPEKLKMPIPYGIQLNLENNNLQNWRYFEGGVGTNCYYNICEFLGVKMTKIGNTKYFDAYKIEA